MKRGEQKRIPAPGQSRTTHVFGGYNWRDDTIHAFQHPRRNSEGFCRFIDYLMREVYPYRKVVLVMDNARIHTSQASTAMLDLYAQRLQVVFLPKYCPFLNPIERYWKHLKGLVNSNRLHHSFEALRTCIAQHVSLQNVLTDPDRFTFSKNL
jgi:transposase